MVGVILCTDVLGNPDPRKELLDAKRALAAAIPDVSREGAHTDEKTKYGNQDGLSFLKTILNDMDKLKRDADEREKRINQEIAQIRQDANQKEEQTVRRMETFLQETKELKHQVKVLKPLRGVAVDIRSRFFAIYRDKENLPGTGVKSVIRDGNIAAH